VEALITGPMQDVIANVQARMSFEPLPPPAVSEKKTPERQANAAPIADQRDATPATKTN
jgi:hypothetical protein